MVTGRRKFKTSHLPLSLEVFLEILNQDRSFNSLYRPRSHTVKSRFYYLHNRVDLIHIVSDKCFLES